MQDELKKIISHAIDTSSNFEQEPIVQVAEGELSDEALESVAGGVCTHWTKKTYCFIPSFSNIRNANKLV